MLFQVQESSVQFGKYCFFIGMFSLMKLNKFFLKFCAAGLVFSGAVSAQTAVEVETARGTVTFEAPVGSNVAVYDNAALDTLTALGVTPKGIVSNILVDYL